MRDLLDFQNFTSRAKVNEKPHDEERSIIHYVLLIVVPHSSEISFCRISTGFVIMGDKNKNNNSDRKSDKIARNVRNKELIRQLTEILIILSKDELDKLSKVIFQAGNAKTRFGTGRCWSSVFVCFKLSTGAFCRVSSVATRSHVRLARQRNSTINFCRNLCVFIFVYRGEKWWVFSFFERDLRQKLRPALIAPIGSINCSD